MHALVWSSFPDGDHPHHFTIKILVFLLPHCEINADFIRSAFFFILVFFCFDFPSRLNFSVISKRLTDTHIVTHKEILYRINWSENRLLFWILYLEKKESSPISSRGHHPQWAVLLLAFYYIACIIIICSRWKYPWSILLTGAW